jgi:hypothetical protein
VIQERYRREYQGEFVILETKFVNGEKQQTREWIENPIVNQHISGRAAVIGSDVDINRFDYTCLTRHRGGLLGKKRLQTYGSGSLWQQMAFNFFVATEADQVNSILESNYDENNIVYSSTRICINNPGHFYTVPYTPPLDQTALSIYLAAFDGHTEIFLLGYNQDTPAVNRVWQAHVNKVFETYRSVKFYLVGTKSNMPTDWRRNRNVECIDYRRFVSYCDI